MRVMSNTSKEAYSNILLTLSEKRANVLNALDELGVANNDEISIQLGWPINRVTGRITELRKLKLVELAYIAPNQFGNRVKFWRVVKPTEQASLFSEKELEVVNCE